MAKNNKPANYSPASTFEVATISDIGDQLIRPAMQVLGIDAHDPENILIEHRATQIVLSIIQLLRQLIISKTPHFTAVAGSVEGDIYLIPCRLVCAVIEEAGGRVINLGANTPTSVLLHACQADATGSRIDLVSVSISSTLDPRSTSNELNNLIHTCNSEGIKVAIGGRCIGDLSLDPLPCLSIHTSLASFHQEVSNALVMHDFVLLPSLRCPQNIQHIYSDDLHTSTHRDSFQCLS